MVNIKLDVELDNKLNGNSMVNLIFELENTI